MQLSKVTICNIFSIGFAQFDVPKGITLVNGYSYDENDPNGSGKSSLAHKAITWGLFGQTAIGAKADKVRRKGISKSSNSYVEIEYHSSRGQAYKVCRSRGPNKLNLWVDYWGKTAGNSHIEWSPLTQSTEKETQVLIDKSLGRDFTSWLQTDFFGQGRKQSYAELSPTQQKAVLEEILPMDQLDDWAEYASKAIGKVKEKLEATRIDKTTSERAADMFRRQRDEVSYKIEKWEEAHKDVIMNLSKTVENYMNMMAGLDASLSTTNREIENVERAEEKLAKFKIAKKLLEEDKCKLYEEESAARNRANEWFEHGAILKGKLVDDDTPFCVTCGTQFSPEKLKETKQRNKEIQHQIDEAHNAWLASCQNAKAKQAKREDLGDQGFKLHNDIAEQERIIRTLPELLIAKKRYEDQIESSDIHGLQRRLAETKAEVNPFSEMFERASADHGAEVLKVTKAEQQIADLLSEQQRLEYWKNAFKEGLKIHLFESVIGFLNERANHYIAALGNGQIHIEFSSYKRLASGEAKEAFNVDVYSDTGGGEYGLLSGGEQQMSSFAIGLALADLAASKASGNANFMVLDEPFTNLGPTNCERLIHFLTTELAKTKSTIFIISNESHLRDLVPNQLRVIKQNGITSLEER